MTANLTKTAYTNTTPGSQCIVQAGCDTMWSIAQQFAMRRLTVRLNGRQLPAKRGEMVDYVQRARLIAGTYARFYLEQEENGNPDKKGRYYWMALAAFASKTVACVLAAWQVDYARKLNDDAEVARNRLGQGNFWLFQDIAAVHWYYSSYPGSFFKCLSTRGADGCHDPVLRNLQLQPWAEESLPILKHLQISPFIEEAFRLIPKIETASSVEIKARNQLKHLMAIAKHEQGVVLQPLIYEQADFKRALATMRSWPIRWISPKQQIVFTNHCETDDPRLKSEAPEDMIVEDYRSRMYWIGEAAKQFHGLMQRRTAFMEIQLSAIADWALAKAREDLE